MKHPFCSDLSEEQAGEYALELLRRLNINFSFKETVKKFTITNYRVKIPKDLIYIRGIRYFNNLNDEKWFPVKFTGNIYHSSYHCSNAINLDSNITYIINNNYIYLSENKGVIEVSYQELMTDKDGYPLIPDNQSYEDALYYYILKEHLFGLWTIGKVTDKAYNKIEQEYSWAVGQASTSMKMSGMDNWEETMVGIRRLIQYQTFSDNGYKSLNDREKIKKRF